MNGKIVYDLYKPSTRIELASLLTEIKNVVSSTIGPAGNSVILYNGFDSPHVTKDGVTVAEGLVYLDHFKESINRIIRETAQETGKEVGDGTTTSTLLACELCLYFINKENALIESMDADLSKVIDFINEQKFNIDKIDPKSIDILKSIVKISSNNDNDVIDLIMDAVTAVGVDGVVDVKESDSNVSSLEIRDGMFIDSVAYVPSTLDINEPCSVILVSDRIEQLSQIKSLMIKHQSMNIPLLLIAKEFSKEIINTVLANVRHNKVRITLIESDGFGDNLYDILDDMALILDTKVFTTALDSEMNIQNIDPIYLNPKIKGALITSKASTLFVNNETNKDEIVEARNKIIASMDVLKGLGNEKTGELRRLEKRLNKFLKSATIHVGGATKTEMIERKDRIDDSVQAMQSAIRGGVVPGGGYIMYKASKLFDKPSPISIICKIPAEVLSNELYEFKQAFDKNLVIDFRDGTAGDPFTLGILDPADVQIRALTQAVATAKMLINSKYLIVPEVWQEQEGE